MRPSGATKAVINIAMPVVGGGSDKAIRVTAQTGEKFSVTADGQVQAKSLGLTGNLTGSNWTLGTYAPGDAGTLAFGSTLLYKTAADAGLRLDHGSFRLLEAGKGIVFTSPNGSVTKTLTIDNAGAAVWT